MKNIYIKYNPYRLKTEIKIDEELLPVNSKLRNYIKDDTRLQDWVEYLPKTLRDEYNDTQFNITFHGLSLDYDDLVEVFKQANQNGIVSAVKMNLIKAKETTDKEEQIEDIFKEILDGPFNELKDNQIRNTFKQTKSNDFEVCVVAPMSSGKSTLINAMLGTKLMPSKQEACTAIITKIKDTPSSKPNQWQAKVYAKNRPNRPMATYEELNYNDMSKLNANPKVSSIEIQGNIPFVNADKEMSLVLVDTPGPNNARDSEHKVVQETFLGESSKALVLYILEGTFGNNDDNQLLKAISESMKVTGKQSKDRFIFVINKMDARNKDDGDVEETLGRVCDYLKEHGIENPNLFPIAALPALNIRQILNNNEKDIETIYDIDKDVKKFNRNTSKIHLEKYASLPPSICSKINQQLEMVKTTQNNKKIKDAQHLLVDAVDDKENIEFVNTAIQQYREATKDYLEEALIHTGIVSAEAAIRQYVEKYAKTAKIKNLVDTFIHKLESQESFEKVKKNLASHQETRNQSLRQIEHIERNISDLKSVKQFDKAVKKAVENVNEKSNDIIDDIVKRYQSEISEQIYRVRGEELRVSAAEAEVRRLKRYAEDLQTSFQKELNRLIQKNLVETGNALLDEYKERLKSLTEGIDSTINGFNIAPLEFMNGNLSAMNHFSVDSLVQTKKVEDGEEWVKNTNKKWWKPWTWGEESGYWRTTYKTVKYVDASELAQEFLSPIQDAVYDNGDNARKEAKRQSENIAIEFTKEFKRLDSVLANKMKELKAAATSGENAEKLIKETEEKLRWLENIKHRVEAILEI